MKPLDKTKKYYTGGLNKAQRKELLNWLKCNDRGWMWTTQSDLKDAFIEYKYIEFCDGWDLSEYVEGKAERVLELFEEETYTESQLTSFGNYLLSDKRKENVRLEDRKQVWYSDIENWKESKDVQKEIKINIDITEIEKGVDKAEEALKELFETISKTFAK